MDSVLRTGERIAHLRKTRGGSRAELAAAIGVHHTSVAYWEKDDVKPSEESMGLILRFFGLTAGQFYSLKLPPEPPKGGRKGAR